MTGAGDAVPLRIAGGLHALVLNGRAPALAEAYRAGALAPGLEAVLAEAMEAHEHALLPWLDSPPQTNEVARAAGLIAGASWLVGHLGLPLVVSELGASAGLNLNFDRYRIDVAGKRLGAAGSALVLSPEWSGTPPPGADLRIIERAGVDRAPLDPVTDAMRLMAYVWADQHERLSRLRAALDIAADHPPPVARADAVDWLEARLATRREGCVHVIVHTIMWQYLEPEARAHGDALIAAAGARADSKAPLARLSLEADGAAPGAALRLVLWPEGQDVLLGRMDFHGRWVDWRAPAI